MFSSTSTLRAIKLEDSDLWVIQVVRPNRPVETLPGTYKSKYYADEWIAEYKARSAPGNRDTWCWPEGTYFS